MRAWREAGWLSWRRLDLAGEIETVEEGELEPSEEDASAGFVVSCDLGPVEMEEDEGDERDQDLDPDGILGSAEEAT